MVFTSSSGARSWSARPRVDEGEGGCGRGGARGGRGGVAGRRSSAGIKDSRRRRCLNLWFERIPKGRFEARLLSLECGLRNGRYSPARTSLFLPFSVSYLERGIEVLFLDGG